MPEAALRRYSFEEYLNLEESSETKSEYFDGHILAMAGGTLRHGALQTRVSVLLGQQLLDGPCVLYSSDVRVRVLATGLATYPDLSVVCGPVLRDPRSKVTATNPTVLVEVLSPGTEPSDRGEKFDHYQQIPSLREYVLISTKLQKVEVYHRNDDGSWRYTRAGPGQVSRIEAIDATLSVDTLYRGIPDDDPVDTEQDNTAG